MFTNGVVPGATVLPGGVVLVDPPPPPHPDRSRPERPTTRERQVNPEADIFEIIDEKIPSLHFTNKLGGLGEIAHFTTLRKFLHNVTDGDMKYSQVNEAERTNVQLF